MWKLQGKIPESFEHIRSDLRVLMEVRPQVVFSLMQVLQKKFIESTSKQTCTWGKEYCEKWGKPDDLSAVLSESSSRYKTDACGITWILAVDQFHILPSTKIPIPNSLCDSLSCEKGKSKEFRRYEARQRFHTIEFSDLNLSPYYQVLGSPVRSMRF